MNIWYISKYASPLQYGFASRHFYLAHEFSKLGHNAVVIASDSNHLAEFPEFKSLYNKEVIDGVETWWVKTLKYKGANSIRRAISWLDFELKLFFMPKRTLERPDVIIVSSLSLLTILNGYLLKRRYGSRLCFEIRDIWPLTIVEEGGFSKWNPFVMFLAWVEKFGYRNSDYVIGTMPNLAEHVKLISSNAKVQCYCIPFGYDPRFYESQELVPPEYLQLHLPNNKFLVGYAGSIGLTNALDTLIACAIQLRENPKIHFLLLGDGDMLENYKRQTEGVSSVTFAPKVKKTQVQSVLSHCDVLYFSVEDSKVWQYGLSLNKLIDYMMAGKPIIGSYNGYPSMVDEAECGTIIPAKDATALREAINKYVQMPKEQLNLIGKRGRDWLIENRRYENLALEYCKLFDEQ